MYAHQPFRLSLDLFRTATYNQLAGEKKKEKKRILEMINRKKRSPIFRKFKLSHHLSSSLLAPVTASSHAFLQYLARRLACTAPAASWSV